MRRTIPLLAALLALAAPAAAMADGGGRTLFIPSAHENGDDTVTLPLHHGTSRGRDVWFVVLDASTSNAAQAWGANRANRLGKAGGRTGVRGVGGGGEGTMDFPGGVALGPGGVGKAR